MKAFKKKTMSCQSNVTQLKFHLQASKYILANKVNLNDEGLSIAKSKKLKPYQRTVCDFSTEKPHKCKICQKSFGDKGYLKTHQRTVHENEKPHKCNIFLYETDAMMLFNFLDLCQETHP